MNTPLANIFTTVLASVSDLHSITLGHMVARAALIFVIGRAVFRVGRTRLLRRHDEFDMVLGIIIGSMLSRGINWATPQLATLGAVLCLELLHGAPGSTPRPRALNKTRTRCLAPVPPFLRNRFSC